MSATACSIWNPDVIYNLQYLNSLVSFTICNIWTVWCHSQLAVFEILMSCTICSNWKVWRHLQLAVFKQPDVTDNLQYLNSLMSLPTICSIWTAPCHWQLAVFKQPDVIDNLQYLDSLMSFTTCSIWTAWCHWQPVVHSYARFSRFLIGFFGWLLSDVADQKQLDHEADAADHELSPLCRCPLGGCGRGLCPSHWWRGTY